MQRSFRAPELRTGVLTPSWLLGPCPPCSAASPVWVGRTEAVVAAVPSPWGGATLRDCPRAPSRPGGDGPPPLLSASWPGPLSPRGLYIHFIRPAPPMLHACYTLQPKCSSSSCIPALPLPSQGVNWRLLYSSLSQEGSVEAGTRALRL